MIASEPHQLPIARFSVDQYHRMIESGALGEDDGLELIEGWVVSKTAKGPAHEHATGRTEYFLRVSLPEGWHARNQAPITLSSSEPEPDLCVARGGRDAYRARHPGAEDVALVVEVSDSSLATDRVKGKVYGAAGIPRYWIVDLPERRVEMYESPAPTETGYAKTTVLREGESVVLRIDGREHGRLEVSSILPRARAGTATFDFAAQLNRPTTCWTIPRSGHASANARMDTRFNASLIAPREPGVEQRVDLFLRGVRMTGPQPRALQRDAGAHEVERLLRLLLRSGAPHLLDVVLAQRIHLENVARRPLRGPRSPGRDTRRRRG